MPHERPVVLFDYDPSRSAAVAARLLDGYKGYLQTEGYDGYAKVGAAEGVTHVACLTHVRRKFDEALKAQKAFARGGLAAEGLGIIQRLYRIEKIARENGLTPEQRHQLRDERSRPIWDELCSCATTRKSTASATASNAALDGSRTSAVSPPASIAT